MKDIHTEHCCIDHGCKYALTISTCTVVDMGEPQSFPCEGCKDDLNEEILAVARILERLISDWEKTYGPRR